MAIRQSVLIQKAASYQASLQESIRKSAFLTLYANWVTITQVQNAEEGLALVEAGRLDEARQQLEKLAHVNRLGVAEEWEFNEWCHARTGQPMGYPYKAWSTGMYVFAYHCVRETACPFYK